MPDLLDDELAAALSDFRVEATRAVRPAELEHVRAGARVRRRRERTVRAATGAVMSVAVLGAGLAVAQPLGLLPVAGDPTSQLRSALWVKDLLSQPVDLPPWPEVSGSVQQACPRDEINYDFSPPGDLSVSRLVGVTAATHADVDGDGRLDVVAVLSCGVPEDGATAVQQVVAFSGKPGGDITVLGQLTTTSQDTAKIIAVAAGSEEGTVTVVFRDLPDSAIDVARAHNRTYAFDGTGFRQVDGPTEFGANPDVVDLVVRADSLVLAAGGDGSTSGTLRIVINNVGPGRVSTVEILIERPPGYTINDPACTTMGGESTTYVCESGSLAPGGERVVTYPVVGPDVVTRSHLSAWVTAISPKGRHAEANLIDNWVAIPVVAG